MKFRKEKKFEKVETLKFRIKNWDCKDEDSIFFGKHDTGTANIPENHFDEETMNEYIKSGQLTLIKQ